MILVRLDRVTHGFGARTLFEDLSFRAGDDARIGLVGRNGTGKTTLLRILAGTAVPERGTRSVAPRVRLGMLDQQIEPDGEETSFEHARDAFRDLLQLMEREEAVREELVRRGDAPTEELTALAHELGHLHDHFARMGGHSIESRVEETLEGLGVGRALWTQPLRTLSGGEKGRVAIARLILSAPDLLLLDEPTNHLDMAATEWLENFLARSSEPFVLVSHDRTLLDRVCTSIAEIENGGLEQHAGNYSEFARKKRARMEQEAKRYELDLKERERQEDFIRRNIAGQNTKQAQSRRKRLEREGPIRVPKGQMETVATFDRLRSSRSGSHVVAARGVSMGYGARVLFHGVSIDLMRGDRLGIVGGNGAGKTTLLRVLSGELAPREGTVEWGAGVKQAGLDQEAADLPPGTTVIDTLWDLRPTTDEVAVRSFLGGFLFRGDEVYRKVGTLSGGERTRLGLARLIWSGPNLIFLDEPTNHLDIASRESLEAALQAYDGTLVVVSHDRYFLDAVATQIFWIEGGEARSYRGTFTEARGKRASVASAPPAPERAAEVRAPAAPARPTAAAPARGSAAPARAAASPVRPTPAAPESAKESRARERVARDRAERDHRKHSKARKALEAEIAALERTLAELTAAMEDDSAKGDVPALRLASEEYGRTRAKLDLLLARWVESAE